MSGGSFATLRSIATKMAIGFLYSKVLGKELKIDAFASQKSSKAADHFIQTRSDRYLGQNSYWSNAIANLPALRFRIAIDGGVSTTH